MLNNINDIIEECWCRDFGFKQTQSLVKEKLGRNISFCDIKAKYKELDNEMDEFLDGFSNDED